MTRRYLGSGLGLLAGAFFMLALTSHGPTPALQVARFPGLVHQRHAPRNDAATRNPAAARLPHGHHYVAAGQRRSDPRFPNARVAPVSADARRPGPLWARSRERHIPVLLAVYHDANAPPVAVPPVSGRHS
jgi:hypothetical protein